MVRIAIEMVQHEPEPAADERERQSPEQEVEQRPRRLMMQAHVPPRDARAEQHRREHDDPIRINGQPEDRPNHKTQEPSLLSRNHVLLILTRMEGNFHPVL